MANCRKIKRNMAKKQLKKEGVRKINRIFSSEWHNAYIRNVAESFKRRGYNVQFKTKEQTNG